MRSKRRKVGLTRRIISHLRNQKKLRTKGLQELQKKKLPIQSPKCKEAPTTSEVRVL